MKVIVAGSRTVKDVGLVFDAIERSGFDITTIISGKAVGVDTIGEMWAIQKGIPVEEYPITEAMWQKYGKAAGAIRNADMAKVADAVIIIWDGESTGTIDMLKKMKKMKKPYFIELDI